jgi:hypothetical protein
MPACKVFTVRIPQEDARRIEFVARVEGISVNDLFRKATDAYFGILKQDDEFVARAEMQLAQDRDIVERLA